MFKNVASQKLIVFAFDSTTNLPKSGDAGNITAYVSKDYGTVTVLADTSATEMDATNAKGYYLFDLAQGETNGDTLLFSAKSATSNIVVVGAPAVIFTDPPNYTSASIDGNGRVDVIKVAGTPQTARDLGASVLLSSGTGTGQVKLASGYVAPNWGDVGNPSTSVNLSSTTVNLVNTITTYTGDTPQTGDSYARIGATGSGLTSLAPSSTALSTATWTGTRAGYLDNLSGGAVALASGVTVTTNNDKTGYSLSQAFPANFSALAITGGGAVTAGTVSDKTGYALTAAYDAAKTASQAGDAMALTSAYDFSKGTVAMTEAYAVNGATMTPAQALHMVWAKLSEMSISGTTMTVNKLDGATQAMSFTLNSATSPTSIARSA